VAEKLQGTCNCGNTRGGQKPKHLLRKYRKEPAAMVLIRLTTTQDIWLRNFKELVIVVTLGLARNQNIS
jgi:hypothetical protein